MLAKHFHMCGVYAQIRVGTTRRCAPSVFRHPKKTGASTHPFPTWRGIRNPAAEKFQSLVTGTGNATSQVGMPYCHPAGWRGARRLSPTRHLSCRTRRTGVCHYRRSPHTERCAGVRSLHWALCAVCTVRYGAACTGVGHTYSGALCTGGRRHSRR